MRNEEHGKVSRWVLMSLFVAAALALIASGRWLYEQETQAIRTEKFNELRAIAELKCNQIVAWRNQRLTEAKMHSAGIIRLSALQWLKAADDAALKAAVQDRLEKFWQYEGYQNLFLAAPDGRLLLSADPGLRGLEAEVKEVVAAAVASRQPVIGDFFRCASCKAVHLDTAAPLLDEAQRPVAVLIMRSDPEQLLYPLIKSWPLPSRSAETLLMRREGDSVLFLNILRHRPDPALTLRIPLAHKNVPVVQAALGRTGEFEGYDYRGVKVLADLRKVPDSPWYMVAKVDSDEILAEVRYRGGVILLLVVLGILMAGGLTALIFNRHGRNLYKALFQMEQERRMAQEETRATLYGIGDGVIATNAAGRVSRMNPVAASLTGWSEEEARGHSIQEVFHIVNEETRDEVENPVKRVLSEGKIVGLANHTVLIARDGTERPIADSGAPIHNERGEVMGAVLVFRDQTAERAARQLLSESEQRFRRLFEQSPLGYQSLDADGNFIEVNPAWLELLGYAREEVIGRWFGDFLAPEFVEAFRQRFPRFKEAGEVHNEFDMKRKDGVIIRVAFDGKIGYDEKGAFKQTHCILNDITERRRAEEALHKSEEQYRSLVEGTPDVIMSFDRQNRHLFVNPAVTPLTGLRPEDFLGKTHAELGFPDEQCRFWEKHLQAVFATGEPNETEFEYEGGGGRIFFNWRLVPVMAGGTVASVLSIARDITAQRNLEKKYQMLFREMLDGFALHEIICDKQHRPVDYRFLAVNPAFECLTGLKGEGLVGKTVREVLPNTEPHWIDTYGHVALSGEPAFFEDYAKELDRYFQVTAFSPTANQFACIFRDITGRKQAEQEKEKLQAQLLQSQKMEAVGQLAGGVAHDFNNMLGVIIGRTEMAMAWAEPATPLSEDLQEIQKAALRSADLTRQLLAFARKQAISPRVLDLNETVAGMLMMLRRLIGENIALAWKPGPALWPVKVDPSQVDQILANLSINARDAIAGTGNLTIETANVTFNDSHCRMHENIIAGDYVMLAVSDTGVGMDQATLDHLFEPFFTTKEVGKGTGLGLAMVYGAVKQNDGFINVYSEPGQGTTFKIYLPRAEATQEPAAAAEEKPVFGTETVLLTEDEAAILYLGKAILEKHGYTVLAARSPVEALALAERHEGPIHLLITDVVMPDLNGKELKDRLVRMRPGIKTLFMSGYTSDVIAHHGIIDEGVKFLQKPFSVNALAQKVRETLDG